MLCWLFYFQHQVMPKWTFIRLQLRLFSCDRVHSGLLLFFVVNSFKIKKVRAGFISRSLCYRKTLKIAFGFNFVSLRAFGSKLWQYWFPVYSFQTKQTELDDLYTFVTFSGKFCGRTDTQTDRQTDRHWLNR